MSKIWTKQTRDSNIKCVFLALNKKPEYITYKDKSGAFKPTAGQMVNININ